MVSRETEQTAALVALLRAQPPHVLEAVLTALGVAQERRPEPYQDRRRCRTCGWGWVRHKALADHPDDGHAWEPVGRVQDHQPEESANV